MMAKELDKVAVIGSRSFKAFDIMKKFLDTEGKFILVSGGAEGADSYAEKYADMKGFQKIIYKPDYDTYGRTAPLIRNEKIIDECDRIIAFYDGVSPGTRHAMELAKKKGKSVQLITVLE